eukprot:1493943-Rhodomonas_salina.3
MSGTDMGNVRYCQCRLWVPYAMRGTEIGYVATRARRSVPPTPTLFASKVPPIPLRVPYAMSGTDIRDAASQYNTTRVPLCTTLRAF